MGGGGSSFGSVGNYGMNWNPSGFDASGSPPLSRLGITTRPRVQPRGGFTGGTPWIPGGVDTSAPQTQPMGDLGFPLSQFPLKKPGVPIDMNNLDATDWYGNPYQDIQAKTQFPPPPFINNNAQGYKML